MRGHLATAGRVVSQCGYNSALEIAQSAVPALYVPFARGQESEQTMRAERFKTLGLCDWLAEDGLDGPALAGRLFALSPGGSRQHLDMNGAANSAQMLRDLAA
jgi:predicted glycosyltransferase